MINECLYMWSSSSYFFLSDSRLGPRNFLGLQKRLNIAANKYYKVVGCTHQRLYLSDF